jgi:Predicted lactoylglutathione lyase
MIGYVTVGTDDLPAATAFFDELFRVLDVPRCLEKPGRYVAWSRGPEQPALAVTVPWNKREATPGNGTMVALAVKTKEEVAALHAKALELGGVDEGAPCYSADEDMGVYAAYFRDLDGNTFNAFCVVRE